MNNLFPYGISQTTGMFSQQNAGKSLFGDNCRVVSQNSHNFAVLDALRFNSPSWVKAQSNSDTTLADGVVVAVLNDNEFVIADSGFFNLTSHGLLENNWYFLSDTVPGQLVDTAPSEFVQPLVKAFDANTIRIYPSTGYLAANGGVGGGTSVGSDVVTATVDFGFQSGGETGFASAIVAATWVEAATTIVCTPADEATSDHDKTDAILEGLVAFASDLTVGVGFTLNVRAPFGTFGQYKFKCLGIT